MQHFISVCGLSLAWVTSENSTSTGMPTAFDSIFFAGPYLVCYCLRSRPHLSVVPRQLSLFAVPPLCSFVQPTLIHVPLPLPDTARFQVQKSFVWFRAETDKGIVCSGHPYSATLTTAWFIRSHQWSNMTPACQPGRKCKKLWEPQGPPQHQDQVEYLTLCTSGVKEF